MRVTQMFGKVTGLTQPTVADKDKPASSARTPASPARTPASTALIPASSLQRASSSAHEYLRRVCQELTHACTETASSSAHEYRLVPAKSFLTPAQKEIPPQ
ncbi:hypothetical protein Bbelb_361700 [Branchiostoma belcheri]|nr:hypothetical protein Bbelb_361700 [Branchiostoma belcheri]